MTLDEREFGKLIGKVEAIGEQIAEMRRSNSHEHAQVVAKLDEVRKEVAEKASRARVRAVEVDVDDLKATRDEWRGGTRLGKAIQGGVGALVIVLGYVAGKGGV